MGKFVEKKKINFFGKDRIPFAFGVAKIDSVNYALLTHLTGPYNNNKGNIVVSIINFKTGRYKNIELHRDSIWDDCEVIKWNGEKFLV